ncbi:M57 family metalloprotease [Algivirga pacifica]|uniref:Peptidase metallopeptidase domain-containing protein n=1 Tax=Algivirga pacifica TaxID=1162670 RepID=A0ABP9CXU1_9BACT
MKNSIRLIVLLSLLAFSACTEEQTTQPENEITAEMIEKLNELGFNTDNFYPVQFGETVVVEQDIRLTVSQINEMLEEGILPKEEHYSTTNLVSAPRVISVYVSLPQNYVDATDQAIARYNAENLTLTFQRVTSASAADITIVASPWYYGFFGILGSAGFPTATGDPHNEIQMTRSYYDGVTGGALVTTIAHEMGHCIGFRHTDYMDRSYSCGGATDDEGASDVGANHIPGTPTTPSVASWMLACSDGTDRPFTADDKTALDYLY